MALKMDYTDPTTGAKYTDLIWVAGFIAIDINSASATVTLHGYATLAGATAVALSALTGQDQPGRVAPVTTHQIVLTRQEIASMAGLFGPVQLEMYDLAKSRKDITPDPVNDPETKVGFFDDATEVELPLPSGTTRKANAKKETTTRTQHKRKTSR